MAKKTDAPNLPLLKIPTGAELSRPNAAAVGAYYADCHDFEKQLDSVAQAHALAGGRTLAEVRDAAGHSNVSITSGYLNVAVEDDGVGSLFG